MVRWYFGILMPLIYPPAGTMISLNHDTVAGIRRSQQAQGKGARPLNGRFLLLFGYILAANNSCSGPNIRGNKLAIFEIEQFFK